MSTREPVSGEVSEYLDLATLRSGDQIRVKVDGWLKPVEWNITIISVDPVLITRPHDVWIIGIHQHVRCRVLVRNSKSVDVETWQR